MGLRPGGGLRVWHRASALGRAGAQRSVCHAAVRCVAWLGCVDTCVVCIPAAGWGDAVPCHGAACRFPCCRVRSHRLRRPRVAKATCAGGALLPWLSSVHKPGRAALGRAVVVFRVAARNRSAVLVASAGDVAAFLERLHSTEGWLVGWGAWNRRSSASLTGGWIRWPRWSFSAFSIQCILFLMRFSSAPPMKHPVLRRVIRTQLMLSVASVLRRGVVMQ